MARGEYTNDLIGVRDGLGIDHDDARGLVAEVNHLVGAVGIGAPQVMIVDLGAVDVLPALIEDAAIGKWPGGIFLFEVGGNELDIATVGVAAVEGGDLGEPAIDPAFAAAGDKHDAAVWQLAWFEVIPRAVGELVHV